MTDLAQRMSRLTPAQRQLLEARLRQKPSVAQPIAIVGMAGKLPGAMDLDAYWDLIVQQRHAFREISPDRWDVNAYYDSDPDAPGKMSTQHCALVDQVAEFDAIFFGISPREASRMDPQQRLLLEVSWQALEHAGIAPDQIAGSATGVFVGIGGTDYSKVPSRYDNYLEVIDAHVGTGNALSIASNRVSYILDLRGPSLSVDTACSSGLLGVHLAVQSLRTGECDLALAGGVNLILSPEVTIAFSKAKMLSPTGLCRPFDSRADGYVRGEGCVMLVLKRLTDATRDGDRVLAVIRGSAANQDGRTSGITAPNSLSQQACLRAALASAGLEPSAYQYIEAHGTGTPLGDPIEIQSLAKLLKRTSPSDPSCFVASSKANIGHTETVSGVAGLAKVVLMMQHGLIPAQTGLDAVNENIQLAGTRIVFPREHTTWSADGGSRIAGVSSFGFGGTNTHVIVESAVPVVPAQSETAERPKHLLAFSAKSAAALQACAANYAAALETLPDEALPNFCYSANVGRSHFHHRAAVVTGARTKLIEQLNAITLGKKATGAKHAEVPLAGTPRIAMLFTGQGSQYHRMAATLYEQHPEFRHGIDECSRILAPLRPISLTDILFQEAGKKQIDETEYTQPALFAVEYALAKLWQSWGVEPRWMLGHSVGEYVAACIAGVFGLEDGLRLIAKRAELMQKMPPNGTMAVIFAGRQKVVEALEGYQGRVALATANGPENNVISGETDAVHELIERFEQKGIGTQRLSVSHAFHSPLMDPMLDEFEEFAATLSYDRPRIPIVANRTGEIVDTASFDASYWRDHLRNAVEFAHGMERLEEQGVDAYLEIGPTAALLGMGRRCLPNSKAIWVGSLRKGRDDWDTLFGAVGDLYLHGVRIDWRAFDRPWPRNRLSIPTYPFKRTRYWMDGTARFGGAKGPSIHPLLGSRIVTADPTQLFECRMSADAPKYLRDHVVQGSMVVPGAAYLEQGFALAQEIFGPGEHGVADVVIQKGMFLPSEGYRVVQIILAPEAGGRASFDTYSIHPDSDGDGKGWIHHVSAAVVHANRLVSPPVEAVFDQAQFQSAIVRRQTHDEFYTLMRERNLNYGPAFQCVHETERSLDACLASIRLPESIRHEFPKYFLHPALCDSMLQIAGGVTPLEEDGSYTPYAYVPMRFSLARITGPVDQATHIYARRISNDSRPSPETVEADTFLLDADGRVLAEVRGLLLMRVGAAIRPEQQNVQDWLYGIRWKPASPGESTTVDALAGKRVVLFADDGGAGGALSNSLTTAGCAVSMVAASDPSRSTAGSPLAVVPTERESYDRLLQHIIAESGAVDHIVHLWSLDTQHPQRDGASALAVAHDKSLLSVMYLCQQLARSNLKAPSLWLVTRQAQMVSGAENTIELQQAPLWGFGRVAALEHPEFHVRLIDLDEGDVVPQMEMLAGDLASSINENQVAYRGGERFVARLAPAADPTSGESNGGMEIPSDGDVRLRLVNAGSLDGLRYERFAPAEPGEGQIAISVRATGLNFSDVLKAMGLYPGIRDAVVPMGIECAGIVTAIGPGVTRFQVGDEVMGVAPYSFASVAVTADYAMVHKPQPLDFEEAATIPITFLTAYYGLRRLAHLKPGERVLIHAAAGGVGLAAIQIARHIGAEIFATAGSDEKREYLRSLGVQHIMSSRGTEFAEEILQITGREGVDVVLNSLPGAAIAKSLSILRAYGRFLEIGKTDIYANTMVGLLPFQDNLSYFAIDLDRMLRQRPDDIREMFIELMSYFESGDYQPIPFTQFPLHDTLGAFRYMAQRKNIGKVVVSLDRQPWTSDEQSVTIHDRATYLITGGLGALGIHIADWLGKQGARHIALMARREPDAAIQARIRDWEADGIKTVVLSGDVTRKESLARSLASLPSEFPPIRGVVHAAGVLADGVIFDMSPEQLDIPLGPKVVGTWFLQECFRDQPLDFFIAFSSVASVLGSPGQGNYAAGNAFLDAMAAYRRRRGQTGLAINWGPWADAGMAAEAGRDKQLASRGMSLLPADKALEALEIILRRHDVQTSVMAVRWPELLAAGSGAVPPLLRDVAADIPTGGDISAEDTELRRTLVARPIDARTTLLVDYFIAQLSAITGLPAEEIDANQPLNTMGLDSLMAIELKNKVEKRLQITIPMSAFLQEPSVASLAKHAAEAFDGQPAAEAGYPPGQTPDSNGRPTPSSQSPGTSVAPPKYLSVKTPSTPNPGSES